MITKVMQPYLCLLKLNNYGNICCFKQLCTSGAAVKQLNPKKRTVKRMLVYTKDGKTFVDWMKVHLVAGRGGTGCVSFMNARSKKGGPYGGDGAPGGDIHVIADENLTQLAHLKHHYRAGKGGNGFSCWKRGKRGKSITFSVPVGTTITDIDTDEVIADLIEHEQGQTLVHGGDAGFGNDHFKAPDHVRPREFTEGGPGEQRFVTVELKSIADIGLVGFPNAGKSTLLHAISRAKPKIADYPFTTLKPNLGVIQYDNNINISVADIPGLVEGAHQDKGLGHVFLRHVERCHGLIYVVDIVNTETLKQFDILKNELEMYKTSLSLLPSLFVANKIDLLPEHEQVVEKLQAAINLPVIGVSGKYRYNIDKLKSMILDLH